MSRFPTFNKPGKATRYTVDEDALSWLWTWAREIDPDDLGELFVQRLAGGAYESTVDYKTVVMTLLLNSYKTRVGLVDDMTIIKGELDERISEILESVRLHLPKTTEVDILEIINLDAIKLYNAFFSLPSLGYRGIDHDVVLYSGIRTYKMIIEHDLAVTKPGSPWTLPTFISTSLSMDTALRFQNPVERVMLQFIIPKDKLINFPYCPLFNIDVQYPQKLPDSIRENEVLLPPYCEFILKGSEMSPPISFNDWAFNAQGNAEVVPHEKISTKIYYLEFVGVGRIMPDVLRDKLMTLPKKGGRKTKKKYIKGKTGKRKKRKTGKRKKRKF